MSPRSALPVDRDQIEQFVGALFRYADEGTYVSMRTFLELEDGPPVDIRAIKLNGDPPALAKALTGRAQLAADYAKPCVFAPPVSTFSNPKQAREIDLANGLALSVELDKDPARARQRLEFLFACPATVVVASGGTWADPATGELHDKLHLHWRLAEPTRTPEAHAKLKQARVIATQLVGGDCTNKPTVHPIRCPGSWHRKAQPKLCRIVAITPDAEIDLHAALGILLDIQPEFRGGSSGDRADPREDRETAELIRRVMAGEEYHAALRDLAWRYLKGGMAAAQVVLTLRGVMDSAPTTARDDRWKHRRDQIPMLTRTAQEKIDASAGASQTHARRIWTSAELLAEQFPEPRFVVPGILPEGLTVLAGRPKLGKSWLLLDWAHAVTSSALAMGKIACEDGEALILALEDSPRRLKGRLRQLGADGNGRLEVTTAWRRIDDGGLDDLRGYLDRHPRCRLIGADTLAKLRPHTSKNRDAYAADVAALEPLQRLAAERHVALVCVTHTRKAAADDWLDAVTGTSGVTGTADTIAVLKRERGQADAFLFGDGRDIADFEMPLRFEEGRWRLLDMSAPEARATSDQTAIIALLRRMNGSGLLRGQIAAALDRSKTGVSNMLRRMEDAGIVEVKGNLWHLTAE